MSTSTEAIGGSLRLRRAILFLKIGAACYVSVACALWTYEAAITTGERLARQSAEAIVQYVLGGVDVEIDLKKGTVINAAKLPRADLERALFRAILQLQLEQQARRDALHSLDISEDTGGKVLK